jgi:SOS-response transcriptional repressor LexA
LLFFYRFNRKGFEGMSKDKDLGEKIYEFIESYIQEHQYSPTVREISKACGKISLSTVNYHLDGLEAEGRIMRSWYKSRSIRLRSAEGSEDELTEEVYAVIAEAIHQEGLAPTQREIADACHISKATVQIHLQRLENQGRILRGEGHRSIQLRSKS